MKRDKNRQPVCHKGDPVFEDLSEQFRSIGEESDAAQKLLERAERKGNIPEAKRQEHIIRCLEIQADEVRWRLTRRSILVSQNSNIVMRAGIHRGGTSLPRNNVPRTGT